MADQVTKGVEGQIKGATGGIMGTLSGMGSSVAGWGQGVLDRFFPPEQRSKLLAKISSFMLKNPKVSAFLGMNIALTGIPLFLFGLFSLTVLLFSVVVGLLLGLLAAVAFTVFCVGTALIVVLPTIFFTTGAACFLFLWGLGGYYVLKLLGGSEGSEGGKQGSGGPAIGDKLNSLTGGRLTGFLDGAKSERSKGNISGYNDEYTKPNPGKQNGKPSGDEKHSSPGTEKHSTPPGEKHAGAGVNGHAKEAQKQLGNVTKHTGADKATEQLNGVHKRAGNTAGTVKGGLSGVTGLAS